MKKFLLLLLVIGTLGSLQANAQFSRYIIRLQNKAGTPYSAANPLQFLTQRAIDRRLRYGIAIDSTDFPIPRRYLDSIRLAGNVTILNTSKWLNQVCISTTDNAALARINSFGFVIGSSPIAAKMSVANTPVNKQLDPPFEGSAARPSSAQNIAGYYSYGAAYNQVHLHNTDFLHNLGFRGQGMQLAIMDAGFYHYLSLPTFDSVRNNNQILGTWDFVANEASVDEDFVHGMACFSTIAANMPGNFTGTAPATSFYLYRTEDVSSEYPVEEQNFAAAAERADSLGVDIFSVSLGYTTFDNSLFDHTYADMNGHTTIMAKATNFAAKKGILVVAAAGNDGNNNWHYIATLADADSGLTVGAVNIYKQVGSFSSYGPSSDGQIKPDVAAVGVSAVVAEQTNGQPSYNNGTSFACPLMAGVSTCLWQAFPELSNMEIADALRRSADRYATPDDRTGYGIPDAKKAFADCIKKLHTQSAVASNCTAVLSYTLKAAATMAVVVERKLPSDTGFVAIGSISFNGAFLNKAFTYIDSLGLYTTGARIGYRLKMSIGADTSFYVDSVSLLFNTNCPALPERKICPFASTYFSVDALAAGYTYQWQVDKGSGFAAIANNATYSGSSANVLVLKNVPDSFYGYTYRCAESNGTNTLYSTPITLKPSSTWTGAISTDWNNGGNWSCGIVPNKYIDVVVKNDVPNYPVVNSSNAACHALVTAAGSSVTVNTGFQLQVAGH